MLLCLVNTDCWSAGRQRVSAVALDGHLAADRCRLVGECERWNACTWPTVSGPGPGPCRISIRVNRETRVGDGLIVAAGAAGAGPRWRPAGSGRSSGSAATTGWRPRAGDAEEADYNSAGGAARDAARQASNSRPVAHEGAASGASGGRTPGSNRDPHPATGPAGRGFRLLLLSLYSPQHLRVSFLIFSFCSRDLLARMHCLSLSCHFPDTVFINT